MRQALVTVGLLGLVFPPVLVLPLRWVNPATTAFMVQHWVTSAAPSYHWTDWDDISPHAANGLPDPTSGAVRRPPSLEVDMRSTRHQNDGLKKRCACPRREWYRCPHAWFAQVSHLGRVYRVSLSRFAETHGEAIPATRVEAKTLLTRIRAEVQTGEPLIPRSEVPTVETGLTFGDLCDRYLVEYVGKISTAHGTRWSEQYLRPRTAEQAEHHLNIIRQIAVPAAHGQTIHLESKPIADLSTVDVRTVQSVRRPKGAVGCNRTMARLRHLCNWAVGEGMIDRSPFQRNGVTLVKLDTHAETERTRRLEGDEERRLLQHASPHLRALIVTALSTGCRQGELLSLQWKQLRRNDTGGAECLVLPATKTKTHQNRIIPVSSDLRAVLEMRRTDPKGNPCPSEAYVFGNEVGERIKSVKTAWRNTCRRAGISDLHFHDLRREFACRLLESKADLHDVREFLGHANVTTTSRYLRSTPVRLVEALERMAASAKRSEEATDQPARTTTIVATPMR